MTVRWNTVETNALLGSKRYKGSAMAVRLNFSRPQLSPNACLLVLRLLIGTVFTSLFLWHWPTRRYWFGNQLAPGVCCVMALACDTRKRANGTGLAGSYPRFGIYGRL